MQPTTNPPPNERKPSKFRAFFITIYRVAFDSIKGFLNDDCYDKASALAFYSVLSIVPLLAVLFGIAQGLGYGSALQSVIESRFIEQPEIAEKLISFAYSGLASVKGSVIAGVGAIALLWSVISLLNSVAATLNAIWKVKKRRSYPRRIRNYIIVLFVAPLFIVASSSLNIYLIRLLSHSSYDNVIIEVISPALLFFLNLFPYFLIWILLSFIYYFVPNTQVSISSAILAAIIAGTAFQLWQWIYIQFQIRLTSYGAIYGSFAALPLFLIWLQISWLIVLSGAEIYQSLERIRNP